MAFQVIKFFPQNPSDVRTPNTSQYSTSNYPQVYQIQGHILFCVNVFASPSLMMIHSYSHLLAGGTRITAVETAMPPLCIGHPGPSLLAAHTLVSCYSKSPLSYPRSITYGPGIHETPALCHTRLNTKPVICK